jgi:hypothetical protein
LHSKQFNITAKTKHSVKYKTTTQRGSGSPETALMNGLLSKFMDYLGRRLAGWEVVEAFQADGQFGGDDTITAAFAGDLGVTHMVRAGAMVGQRLEVDRFERGQVGVNYLSRYYTELVWSGDNSSTCDLPRMLSKLHVTVGIAGYTPLEKLTHKLRGLALTDNATPIIRQILFAARRVGVDLAGDVDRRLGSWWHQYGDNNWPNSLVDEAEFLQRIVPKAMVDPLYTYLQGIDSPEQLLTMPTLVEVGELPPVIKAPVVVVDDDVKVAKPAVLASVCKQFLKGECRQGAACKFKHVKICRDFQRGSCTRAACKFQHQFG